jgi:hypothetical protein
MTQADEIVKVWKRHQEKGFSLESLVYALLTSLGVEHMTAIQMLTTGVGSIVRLDEFDASNMADELMTKYHVTPREKLEALLGDALKVYQLTLSSGNEQLRSKAAMDVIDRVLGKPTQSLEVKSLSFTGTTADLKALDNDLSATLKRLEKMKAARDLLPTQLLEVGNVTRGN